ncbi:MAG: gluconate 2-dehydrogenase subunit 3 family protein [Bacteroidota bacterium]|nr:gluconate 2-dehydrogenase subunit 3 family protein [Bacteroidota bacterium]
MNNNQPSSGQTEQLLQTDLVLPQTKAVLQQRLNTPVVTTPSFFSVEEFATLQAVCKRLLPQPSDRKTEIDIAGIFDANLSAGKTSKGWRYNVLPPDEVMYKQGLLSIEQSSQSLYHKAFEQLDNIEQEELLKLVQNQTAPEKAWNDLSARLFFTELFAALVEIYYSHPFGKDEINDVSFADAKGCHNIGLNEVETQDIDSLLTNKK